MFPDELSIQKGTGGLRKTCRHWLQTRNGENISVRFCIQPFRQKAPAWRLHKLRTEATWPTLIAFLNRDNKTIDRLLVYPSGPKPATYVSTKAAWLKEGIEVRDLNDFWRIVKSIIDTRCVRMVSTTNRPRWASELNPVANGKPS